MARSGSGISAIFASTALSPSASTARGPGRAAAFFAAFFVVLLALRALSVIFVPFHPMLLKPLLGHEAGIEQDAEVLRSRRARARESPPGSQYL
jgi:hypothetical protein